MQFQYGKNMVDLINRMVSMEIENCSGDCLGHFMEKL